MVPKSSFHPWAALACSAGLLLATSTTLRAERYAFTHYTSEDGIAQQIVKTILQDRNGHLWLGTLAGLSRYDGLRFESYGPRQGLTNDHVNALAEAPDGTLFIGTDGTELMGLHNDRFEAYRPAEGGFDRGIQALAVDESGAVFCGTPNGMWVWRAGQFEALPLLSKTPIHALLVGPRGQLWIGAQDGLYRHQNGQTQAEPAIRGAVRALARGPDGRLWVARDGSVVAYRDGQIGERYTAAAGIEALDTPIRALLIDRHGDLWISAAAAAVHVSDGGIRIIDSDKGLALTSVWSFLEDREGIIWIGGFGGLAKFLGRPFTTYTENDGLAGDGVLAILRDRRGRLWVGSVGGLAVSVAEHRFRPLSRPPEVTNSIAWMLHEDRQGVMRAGFGASLVRVQDDALHLEHTLPVTHWITSMVETADGTLWLAARHSGLLRRTSDGYRPFPVPDNSFTDIRFIVDRRGHFWVSGDRGLSHFDGEQWTLFDQDDGLAGPRPYFMLEDARGHIWVGYHSSLGLSRYDGSRFVTYTGVHGLANDAIYSIGQAPDGSLWAGSARGVDRITQLDQPRFRNYGPAEGYGSFESNAGAFHADRDGILWFGTAEGLSRYDPARDLDFASPPPLRLAGFTLGDRTIADGATVGHRDNDLAVQVDAPTYVNQRQLDIEYRVRGYEERWRPLPQRQLQLPNLPTGSYRFEVRARRYHSDWSPPLGRSFVIEPPFWQTWTFRIATFLGLFGLFALALRFRLRRMQAANARLQATVDERTRANEALTRAQRMQDEFIAKISHEIRTPMNGIIGMTELALDNQLDHEQRDRIEIVRDSAENLLVLINEILDLSDLESGQLTIADEPFMLRACVEAAVGLFAGQAEKRNIALSCTVAREVPEWLRGDAHHLRHVLLNLVGNAVKFTDEGQVTVTVQPAPDHVRETIEFHVRDTGIGIAEDRRQTIFDSFSQGDDSATRRHGGSGLGLTIAHRLVAAMNGRFSFTSEVGEGSCFSFALPLYLADSPVIAVDERTESSLPHIAEPAELRVLVVEDNPINQKVLVQLLERRGHRAIVVDNGSRALKQLLADDLFDLVLMDIQMPEMDGLAATRAIRALDDPRLAEVPIIAVTADAMAHRRELCLEAGMDGYVSKPIDRELLFAAIARVLSVQPGASLDETDENNVP